MLKIMKNLHAFAYLVNLTLYQGTFHEATSTLIGTYLDKQEDNETIVHSLVF